MSQEILSGNHLNVLLVPGLYPRGCEALQRYAYTAVVPVWEADGYNVKVEQFGWNDRMSLADRQNSLLETVDAMPDNSYTIGASAGGLAVINAFAERPEKFRKVLTVAAPLFLKEEDFVNFKSNPLVPIPKLLEEVYHQADNFLSTTSAGRLSKIISLHGKSDPRVPPHWSQRPGIESHAIPVNGHGRIIMSALRNYRWRTQELLSTESPRPLRYAEGWREIFEAPDAVDYQLWLGELTGTTYRVCHELPEVPDWAEDTDEITYRWQRAIELVTDIVIDPEGMADLTQAKIVGAALISLKETVGAMGWGEEGLAFTVANMFTGVEATIDLRELPDVVPDN